MLIYKREPLICHLLWFANALEKLNSLARFI